MKSKPPFSNMKEMEGFRRHLRNHSTAEESTLWKYLKNRQLDGRKFRRQFSMDSVVMDFYCVSEHLCVELDGQDHFAEEGILRDAKRDAYLKHQGIKVIRFENKAVWNNLEGVLNEIRQHFNKNQ